MKKIVLMIFTLSIALNSAAQSELRWLGEVTAITEADYDFKDEAKELIILTGSSSARMWKTVGESFPDYNVKNYGFGGSQMFELLFFVDELIISEKPDKVLIYEGDNDINAGKSTREIMLTTDKVVSRIKDALPATEIYLISPKPSLSRWSLMDKYIDLNEKMKAYCENGENLTFLDVWNPMLNTDGTPIKDIFISDGLHMNEKGYKIWHDEIGPIVSKK